MQLQIVLMVLIYLFNADCILYFSDAGQKENKTKNVNSRNVENKKKISFLNSMSFYQKMEENEK